MSTKSNIMNEQPWKIKAAEGPSTLTVIDLADPSVGLMQAEWQVACPFDLGDVNNDELEAFRQAAIELYAPFAEGRLIAEYNNAFYNMEQPPA
jgi:hypothetical protein